MTTYVTGPRLLKGAIVLLDDATGVVQSVIALQYNPEKLTRTLQIRGVGQESGDRLEVLRLKGPPAETIHLEAELDATDALEAGEQVAEEKGIHPQLAALETLVYPSSQHLTAVALDANSGSIEIAPAEGPVTLFVFGPKRVVPVRVTELQITEEAFDPSLNPIRAKVTLGMRVLTVDDMGFDGKGGGLFMAHLESKERLAAEGVTRTLTALGLKGIP